MKHILAKLFIIVIAASASSVFAAPEKPPVMMPRSDKCFEVQKNLRKLWAHHVIWTRQYIVSTLLNSPDASAAADRLLKNQEDIGNSIQPFYGRKVARQLTDLLKQHILIAVDVVKATQEGNKAALKKSNKLWHENATDIATLLSTTNTHWKKQNFKKMLDNHLLLTTKELNARHEGKWKQDIDIFDKILDQACEMADGMWWGISEDMAGKCPLAK